VDNHNTPTNVMNGFATERLSDFPLVPLSLLGPMDPPMIITALTLARG
jgi:hypothetical protein